MAIVGSCVDWPWCLTSPVFSDGGMDGDVYLGLSVRDVGQAAVGNAVSSPSPSGRLLFRSPVFWIVGFGVGVCCRCAVADAKFLVGYVVADPE